MIPRKIHVCWLSGDPYPPFIDYCISTWRKVLPGYEIVLWDSKRFDVNSVPWVKEAYEARKYAFAADYIRFYALYTEGGIYLDSDVEVLKTFDALLHAKSFLGYEASTGHFEAAVVGSEAGMPWCKEILDSYKGLHFSYEAVKSSDYMLAPQVVGRTLQKMYPEIPLSSPSEVVSINGGEVLVCPSDYFSPIKFDIEKSYSRDTRSSKKYYRNKNTICIHRFTGSWTTKPSTMDQLGDMLRNCLVRIFGQERGNRIFRFIKIHK